MKTLSFVALNMIASALVAFLVVTNVEATLPSTIRCERLEASESIDARQVVTGYVWVGVPGKCGSQAAVTINAGADFAGVQVTDGKKWDVLWVESERHVE